MDDKVPVALLRRRQADKLASCALPLRIGLADAPGRIEDNHRRQVVWDRVSGAEMTVLALWGLRKSTSRPDKAYSASR